MLRTGDLRLLLRVAAESEFAGAPSRLTAGEVLVWTRREAFWRQSDSGQV
jgi:hypothetical protein